MPSKFAKKQPKPVAKQLPGPGYRSWWFPPSIERCPSCMAERGTYHQSIKCRCGGSFQPVKQNGRTA